MYRILIVEDEDIIRKWLVYGFDYESINCIVVGEADDGQLGVEKIRALRPDIVITDINMPGKDAFQMFEETKSHLYAKVIVSGYNSFPNAKKAISYDAIEFIVKPIDENQLKAAIEKAIETYNIQKLYLEQKHEFDTLISSLKVDSEEIQLKIKDPLVKNMIEFIEEHYPEKFTFNEVVEELGYSATLLYKKFRVQTGQSFNDYLNRYRIRKAVGKMKEGQYKLYEISEQVGFSEYKYFNKVFKKYIGYPAREFLQKLS